MKHIHQKYSLDEAERVAHLHRSFAFNDSPPTLGWSCPAAAPTPLQHLDDANTPTNTHTPRWSKFSWMEQIHQIHLNVANTPKWSKYTSVKQIHLDEAAALLSHLLHNKSTGAGNVASAGSGMKGLATKFNIKTALIWHLGTLRG